ncbi:MAG: hypothetical protein OEY92_04440, partial [Elusimicrobiota bacterium]|nr:hypothetical protein [Elusimicrobiota bacterium]
KVEGFLELLGYEAIDMAVPAPEIAGKVREILTNRRKLLEQISPRVAKLQESSRKNMEMVENLL